MADFTGTSMNDLLRGTPYADQILGLGGDDVLSGWGGDDDLQGGAGNDRLIGGPGADTMNGGPGMDIASYINSPRGVHVDMSTSFVDRDQRPPIRGGDAEGDALSSIEIIWGSDFADVITGTHAHNELYGNGGSDMLHGMRGNDLLRGGMDDDQLLGGDGMDTLYGDMGVDDLQGGNGNDQLFGGDDDDTLDGGPGDDLLEGGPGADDLTGGTGSDTAAYTMSSEAVMVDLRYPSSSPAVKAPMGGDAMGDTIGTDIENLRGSMYDDVLIGDDIVTGDDPATGTITETDHVLYSGKNKLYGNMGNDMLKGMGGADTLHGGKGNDTLYGGMGDDTLRGEMGDDALKGEDGSDTLAGGPGADKLFGGSVDPDTGKPTTDDGDTKGDTADYSMSDAGVRIKLTPFDHDENRETPDQSAGEGGHAEGDELYDIENVTGSAHSDMLEGDDNDNVLMGMGGNEWDNLATPRVVEGGLFGGEGNDTLSGGDGMDLLEGEEGRDDLWGGAGDDLIRGGAGNDFSQRAATTAELAGTLGEGITLVDNDGITNATGVEGTTADDVRIAVTYPNLSAVPTTQGGGTGGTFMRAGLYGGSGDDTLIGGGGADYIDGGNGIDTASYAGSDAVTVNIGGAFDTSTPPVLIPNTGGDAAGDVLRNIENLTGGTNGDTLHGNARANVLTGGGGDDNLHGYGGADTFVFNDDPATTGLQLAGTATINDFSAREGDQIDLTAFNLSGQELSDMLDTGGSSGTVTLNLAQADDDLAGTFVVIVQGRDLDVDDFII